MADIANGQPVRTGDTNNLGVAVFLIPVLSDGTRRILARSSNANIIYPGAVVPARTDGFIACTRFDFQVHSSILQIQNGAWLGFPDNLGPVPWLGEPTTPGTDFYRFRSILAEHAQRFLTEHNPANLRLASPLHDRIEHIAHELSNEDRTRAGNVSSWTRELIGYLWWRIEQFRQLPYGTPALEVAWKAKRDELEGLFMPFCDLCEGSGMSHRTISKHPPDDWQRWAEARVRFSVNRDFEASPVAGASQITPAVAFANRINFRNALDHFGEGHADDDYQAPRSAVRAQPAAPVMPVFEGDYAMERAELASYWRIQYDALKAEQAARPGAETIFATYRNFIAFNLLFMLHDENLSTRFPNAALQANKAAAAATILITDLTAYFTPASFDAWNATFPELLHGFVVYRPPDGFVTTTGNVTDDGTAGQFNPVAAWDTAIREQRFDVVDAILGDRSPGRPAL